MCSTSLCVFVWWGKHKVAAEPANSTAQWWLTFCFRLYTNADAPQPHPFLASIWRLLSERPSQCRLQSRFLGGGQPHLWVVWNTPWSEGPSSENLSKLNVKYGGFKVFQDIENNFLLYLFLRKLFIFLS